jgi:hypothetical protein
MLRRGTYIGFLGAFILLVLLIIPSTSAGFPDWIKTITGKIGSQPTNVSITVAGSNLAQIIYVESITSINPIESSSKTITFNVTMYDPDGVADLNDTSVNASFSMTGETTRYDSLCSWEQDVDSNSANYTCSIDMMYWDGNGDWNIDVARRFYRCKKSNIRQ